MVSADVSAVRAILLVLLGTVFFIGVSAAEQRPNVIFWMADDAMHVFDDAPVLPPGVRVNAANMPEHEALRADSGIFTRAYAGSPKCAPARFNILTMKYCSRSASLVEGSHHALVQSGEAPDARVPVDNMCKLTPGTAHETLPAVLRDNGYETIHSGKWHLLPGDRVWELDYAEVERSIMDAGFTRVGGAYAGNVPGPDEWWKASAHYQDPANRFSHNMEWQLGEALRHVDGALGQGKPFFLYLAPTLPNNYVDYREALFEYDPGMTPAGLLRPEELYPSGMPPRQTVWDRALEQAGSEAKAAAGSYAGHIWLDDALGAFTRHLESLGELDNTVLVVTTDHGMTAKGQLYEGGVRVFNFVRYPAWFGGGRRVEDVLVANVDLGATLLEHLGIAPEYEIDGVSFLGRVAPPPPPPSSSASLGQGRARLVTEVANDRAVYDLASGIKYVSRSWLNTHETKDPREYPYFQDVEQVYDLRADPAEQHNLAYCADAPALLRSLREEVCAFDARMALPGAPNVEGRCPGVAFAAGEFRRADCAAAGGAPVGLTLGAIESDVKKKWVQYTDESGKAYWQNTKTGVTTYEEPAVIAEKGPIDEEQEEVAIEAALPPLPPAMTLTAATPVTTLTSPAAEDSTKAAASVTAQASPATDETAVTNQASPPVAEDTAEEDLWAQYTDEVTGNAFWYNSATGESTWDRPSEGGAQSDQAAAALLAERKAAKKMQGLAAAAAAAASPVTVATEEEKVEQDDWAQYTDEVTGNAYWYNARTGESTWDKPAGAGLLQ
uniref:WW domain-containing protein n=1 Tax=Heterosigma akashiwo TaxID=2829 RepID=A0A7S3XMQ2_HETAK